MYLWLGTPFHYRIDDLEDFVAFIRHVDLLVDPQDFLAFSALGVRGVDEHGMPYLRSRKSGTEPREFLKRHQLPPDGIVRTECLSLDFLKDEFPDAFAVLWPAKPDLLQALSELLRNCEHSSEFCDHVVAYGPRGEIFTFHDAFGGGNPLYVSSIVPEDRIREFCWRLNVGFEICDAEV